MGLGFDGARRRHGPGPRDQADDEGRAPGVSARTDRLPPSRLGASGADLESVQHTIGRLAQLADQLDHAIDRRDFYGARALAGAIVAVHAAIAPALARAVERGASPDAVAALAAEAAPLSARLDAVLPLAPAPMAGLGVNLADPSMEAAQEAAWLRSLGAPSLPDAGPAPARRGDPFGAARFAAAVLGEQSETAAEHRRGTFEAEAEAEPETRGALGWQDVRRAVPFGPLTAAPRSVQNVIGGPLFSLLRGREAIHLLFDPTRSDPVKHGVADVVADLANDPAYSVGFAEGAFTGTTRAVFDVLKGSNDAARLAQEVLVKLATFQHRALLARAKKAIDDVIAVAGAAPALLDEFARRWRASDSYARGAFQGEVIAYIATQLAIIIAGSLSAPQVIAAGPYVRLIVALRWLDNPLAEIVNLARGAKLSAAALEALHGASPGRELRALDPMADGRAAPAFEPFADLDGQAGGRPLATADDLARTRRLAALDEIAAIPIVPLRKGAAPGIDRDALYVSRADGERLPALLRTIKPDLEIKPYRKGVLVRDGVDEWWIEFDDRAAALSPERAAGIDAAHGGIGLPEPNVATVELWGFAGQRADPSWTAEQRKLHREVTSKKPLLWAGHVGISTDGGKTIHGFTPKPPRNLESKPREVMERLKEHEAFSGRLDDDTEVFTQAQQMADEHGWQTTITKTTMVLDRTQHARLVANMKAIEAMKPGAHGFGYSFPLDEPHGAQHFAASNGYDSDHVRNCATFPEKLGLPVPERSGNLRTRYMPKLEEWARRDAPIDARTQGATP